MPAYQRLVSYDPSSWAQSIRNKDVAVSQLSNVNFQNRQAAALKRRQEAEAAAAKQQRDAVQAYLDRVNKPSPAMSAITRIGGNIAAANPIGTYYAPTSVSPTKGVGGGGDPYYTQVLQRMGLPISQQNMQFMRAWHAAEGGTASYNPFNTTMPSPGATNYNSVPVRNYASLEAGIQATINTLKNSRYAGIRAALARNDPHGAASALGASPWGTSGSLVNKVLTGYLGY